jgi:hypothetical protein
MAVPNRRELQPTDDPRRIRIVTTRAQRRARPKAVYAVVAIGVVFVIFMAQLLLTIALSSGAYRIASLQTSEKSLGRVQSSLQERLNTLGSVQNLAANAQELGMVSAATPSYLKLSTGVVAGVPTATPAGAPTTVANGSTDSVPNSLLVNVPVISPTQPGHGASNAADSATTTTESTGDATTTDPKSSVGTASPTVGVADPNALPSPNTH